ncbi:hypothetical protein PVAG01_04595 [Phlyctema vagabunda]|uniref:Clr5 domain-containing protein n=1 Tax=Phlyctema vagabunda TaxID=108571 RepID=A0ABR4PHN4_9HELO
MDSQGPLPPARFYSSKVWDQKQAVITRLYRDEKRKLDDVRLILSRQYDFTPPKSTLKKRIQRWDLDRKHKLPDMLYALRIASERRAQGKETTFLIRERVVTFDEIRHYFKRRGDRTLQSALAAAATADSTTAVRCLTPDPVSTASDVDTDMGNLLIRPKDTNMSNMAKYPLDSALTIIPNFDQVDALIPLNDSLGQLNRLLHSADKCYQSVLKNGNVCCANGLLHQEWYMGLHQGLYLLRRGDMNRAFKEFNYAFDVVPRLIVSLSYLILPLLSKFMLDTAEIESADITSSLLGLMIRMTLSRFPDLCTSLVFLRDMPQVDRQPCAARIMEHLRAGYVIRYATSYRTDRWIFQLCLHT